MNQTVKIKFGSLSTSKRELIDITKGWIAISIVFAIARAGFNITAQFLTIVAISALTVGIGFLLHELAHKVVAQRYGCFAEFRAYNTMLLLAILLSFAGFVFAAPGAVMIAGHITKKENGLISVAGPWTNIVIAFIFAGLAITIPAQSTIWNFGTQINLWLALFNMLPFWILDGKKVWNWNKSVWITTIAIIVVLMAFL
jgi:Zn-dependent protease